MRGFKIAAARKVLNANREGVDKTADVMTTLTSVRDELKLLKKQLDGLVWVFSFFIKNFTIAFA